MGIMDVKFRLVLLTLSVTIFFTYLEYVVGQEKSCKQITADLTKKQMGGITNCTKAMKFKNGKEKSQKASCILKCVMRNAGLLNSEYKLLDPEEVKNMVHREFPGDDLRERVLTELTSCSESHGTELNPEEEFCKSYDAFVKCLAMGFTRVCP